MSSQVYFKNIQKQIIEHLQNAEYSVDIAVAWFTDKKIINTLSDLLDNDVDVRILYYDDHINNDVYDLFQMLYNKGAKIRCSKDLMHNKFCIIDDAVVINGSYNWTNNANLNNHENITISYDEDKIVNSFSREFERLFDLYKASEQKFKTEEELLEEYLYKQAYPSGYPCFLKKQKYSGYSTYMRYKTYTNQYIFVQNRNDLIQYYSSIFCGKHYDAIIYNNVYGSTRKDDDNFVYFNDDFFSDKITVEVGQSIFQIDKRGKVCSEEIKYSECLAYGCYKVVKNGKCIIYNQGFQSVELPQCFIPQSVKRINDFILLVDRSASLEALLCGNKYIIYNRISIKEGNIIECEEYPIFEKMTTQYLESSIRWENINKVQNPKKVRILQYNSTLLKIKDNKDLNGIYLSDEDYLWGYIYKECVKKCRYPISYRAFEETKNEFRRNVNKSYTEQSVINDFIKRLQERDSVVQTELRKRIPYYETSEYRREIKEKEESQKDGAFMTIFFVVCIVLAIILWDIVGPLTIFIMPFAGMLILVFLQEMMK